MKRPLFVLGIISLLWTVVLLSFFRNFSLIFLLLGLLGSIALFSLKRKQLGLLFLAIAIGSLGAFLDSIKPKPSYFFSLDEISLRGTVLKSDCSGEWQSMIISGETDKHEKITAQIYGEGLDVRPGDRALVRLFPSMTSFEDKALRARGIDARGRATKIQKIGCPNKALRLLYNTRENLDRLILDGLGDEAGGFVLASCFGDRAKLEKSALNSFLDIGAGHIFSASGIHVASVFGALGLLFFFFRDDGLIKLVGISLGLLLYMSLVRSSYSIARAGLMCIFALVASYLNRQYDSRSAFGACLLILNFLNPYVAFDKGFILSFGIVFGIYLLYPALWRAFSFKKVYIDPKTRLGRFCMTINAKISSTLAVGLSAFLASSLILSGISGYIYTYSFLASLPICLLVGGIISLLPFFILERLILGNGVFSLAIRLLARLSLSLGGLFSSLPNKKLYIQFFRIAILAVALALALVSCKRSVLGKIKLSLAFFCFGIIFALGILERQILNERVGVKGLSASAIIEGEESYLVGSLSPGYDEERAISYLSSRGKSLRLMYIDNRHRDGWENNFKLVRQGLANLVAYKSIDEDYLKDLLSQSPMVRAKKLDSDIISIKENGEILFKFHSSQKDNTNFLELEGISLLKPSKKCDIIITINNRQELIPYEALERILRHFALDGACHKEDCLICQKGRAIASSYDGAIKNGVFVFKGDKRIFRSIFDKDKIYIRRA